MTEQETDRDSLTGETNDDQPWFRFVEPGALSEKHTGLQARYPHLTENAEAEGLYEDLGHRFRIGSTEYVKAEIDAIGIESIEDDDDGPEPIEKP